MLPLISAPPYIPENKFAEAIKYSSYSIEKPKLKSPFLFDTITTEDIVRENNNKILEQIYKSLE